MTAAMTSAMTAATPVMDEGEYAALLSGTAVQDRPDGGLLILTGADRVDFLQRMTTANVAALRPGQAALAVLTSPVARIEFVFTILCRADDLWLLPARGETDALAGKLRSQIFFMDKVKVENPSANYRRRRVMGPGASALLAELGLPSPAQDDTFQQEGGLTVLRQERYDVPGYEVVASLAEADALSARLAEGGARFLADQSAYHSRRVELGRPAPGAELSGEYNPLEAGLAWAVADSKGCYTGQEIIARQITYDKVTKTLVLLRSDALLTPGAELSAEGRPVGVVTSSAHSPTAGGPVALAVVKRPHNQPGVVLAAGGGEAVVASLQE